MVLNKNKKKLNKKLPTKKKQILKTKKTKKHIQKGGNYGTLSHPTIINKKTRNENGKIISYDAAVAINIEGKHSIITEYKIFNLTKNVSYDTLFSMIKTFLKEYKRSILISIFAPYLQNRFLNSENYTDELGNGLFDEDKNKSFAIKSVPLFEKPIELSEYIIKSISFKNLLQLSAKKPVAEGYTQSSGYGLNNDSPAKTIQANFLNYSDKEKKELLSAFINGINKDRKKDDIIEDIDIFMSNEDIYEKGTRIIFYIPSYLSILCKIFGYTLEEAKNILDTYVKYSDPEFDKKMAFIYIAFGDLTDIKSDPDSYNMFNRNSARRDFNTQYQPLFEEYQKKTGWSN